MNRRTAKLVTATTLLAAGFLAAGCAQGTNLETALPAASPSLGPSVSPPTVSPRTISPPTREPRSPRVTTAPPSIQPTTVRVIVPVPKRSSEASASPSASPAASGSGSGFPWVWVVLGILVVAVVVALIARHFSRRSAATASWRSKVIDASAKGSALYDMMSLAEVPGALTGPEASARWADIRRRGDDLVQELYVLRDTAPGPAEQARVADVLASLQAARTALEAQHIPGGTADPLQEARVHELLQYFDASLRALRSPEDSPRTG